MPEAMVFFVGTLITLGFSSNHSSVKGRVLLSTQASLPVSVIYSKEKQQDPTVIYYFKNTKRSIARNKCTIHCTNDVPSLYLWFNRKRLRQLLFRGV